jgi:hypothetical protein
LNEERLGIKKLNYQTKMQKSNDFHFLHPFTFRQVGVSPTEFQALPGMEVGALREKKPQGPDHFLDRACKLFFPREQGYSVVGAPGGSAELAEVRAPNGPRHPTERRSDLRFVILFPSMLFARKALTSGPHACIFRGNENHKSE